MVLRVIYTFLIGIFLSIFVGVGISAFYKSPISPEMPSLLKYCSSETAQNASQYTEFKKEAIAYDSANKVYLKQEQLYNRNVAIIAVIAASILVIISLTFLRKMLVIADGILLGGVLTLIYSVIRGFGVDDTMFQFLVVSIGLFIALILGYIKFILPTIVHEKHSSVKANLFHKTKASSQRHPRR